MSLGEIYPWLKAVHVAAALAFVGGVLAVSVFLRAACDGDFPRKQMARRVRRWDRMVTTPAMLLVWGLGLTLATTGQWFAAGWLQAKFALVLALSSLHGVQSGRLRRLAGGAAGRPMPTAVIAIACTVGIAILAVVKPWT